MAYWPKLSLEVRFFAFIVNAEYETSYGSCCPTTVWFKDHHYKAHLSSTTKVTALLPPKYPLGKA